MLASAKEKHSALIKQTAKQLGFDYCGISEAVFLEEEAPRLETWLNKNMHGQMKYMENYFDKRLDPRLLVDGAKSVVSLLLNYFPEERPESNSGIKISKYAYGTDYHLVIKDKCKTFIEILKKEIGDVNGRCFVDSAPVLDKAWAKKSGLGWVGKNSNLINKESGSFFFVAELIIDVELEYDSPIKDYCGTCTKCIDACPTDAIVAPYIVDGSKCISYLTIELKDNIPAEFKGKMDGWAFGCDVCQDVCPWNRFSSPHTEPLFNSKHNLENWSEKQWMEITEEVFREVFKNSPVKRTGYKGLKRNLEFITDVRD
ncbi:MAG: tRNA epoxyqueuosine(34) reductase QueG [Bacteroidia bacterium]